MCVNDLSKVALDSASAGIEPATSSRKSNALTTTPTSRCSFISVLFNCAGTMRRHAADVARFGETKNVFNYAMYTC